MLPPTHPWSRRQKCLIVGSFIVLIALAGVGIYAYERYYRGPNDSVLVGTWKIEDGCIDCTHLVTLEPNHNAVGFGDYMGREGILDYRGRWYAGGELLVIRYDTPEQSQSIIMRILDITPDVIRVRWGGSETRLKRSERRPPQASNHTSEVVRQRDW